MKDVSLLSDEELNQKVSALVGGWKPVFKDYPFGLMQNMTNRMSFRQGIPDYCNSLDAMHEAEKIVLADEDAGYRYDMALCRIVNAYEVGGMCNHMRLFHATARQRAEAFVKTMEAK